MTPQERLLICSSFVCLASIPQREIYNKAKQVIDTCFTDYFAYKNINMNDTNRKPLILLLNKKLQQIYQPVLDSSPFAKSVKVFIVNNPKFAAWFKTTPNYPIREAWKNTAIQIHITEPELYSPITTAEFKSLFDKNSPNFAGAWYDSILHRMANNFVHEYLHLLYYSKAWNRPGLVYHTFWNKNQDNDIRQEMQKQYKQTKQKVDNYEHPLYLGKVLEMEAFAANVANSILSRHENDVEAALAHFKGMVNGTSKYSIDLLENYRWYIKQNKIADGSDIWKRFCKRVYEFILQEKNARSAK